MPDEKVDPAVTATAQTAETKAPTVEELAAQLESIKKAQAGSDKAYQEAAKKAAELAAENEKLKKEKMSEKERAEFELSKQKAELEQKAREVAEATLRLTKARLIGEAGLPLDVEKYIGGSNDEEIKNSLNDFIKYVDKLVQVRVNQTLVGTEKPKAGGEPVKPFDPSKMSLKEMEELAALGKLKL